MFRKCIKKINNIIQWSKKFYFAHFFVWLTWFANTLYVTVITLFYIEEVIKYYPTTHAIILGLTRSDLEGFLALYLLYFPFFCGVILYAIIPATFLIMLVKFAFSRKFTVTSKYLLDNKKYNIFYTIGFIYAVIIWFLLLITGVGILMLSYTITIFPRY